MTDFSGVASEDFRTRAVILSSDSLISALAQEIFRANDSSAAWISDEIENGSDFLILNTNNITNAAAFKPTIALICSGFEHQNWQSLPENITPGGILVYPQVCEQFLPETSGFFRKVPFISFNYQVNGSVMNVNTDLGELMLKNLDETIVRDLGGLQHFCAQFGIMEEDFFATLAELY